MQLVINNDNSVLGTLFADERTFSTGSRGFYASGKVQDADGKRYQISANIVEIGSKPKGNSRKRSRK